jgi:hypothetical protein
VAASGHCAGCELCGTHIEGAALGNQSIVDGRVANEHYDGVLGSRVEAWGPQVLDVLRRVGVCVARVECALTMLGVCCVVGKASDCVRDSDASGMLLLSGAGGDLRGSGR